MIDLAALEDAFQAYVLRGERSIAQHVQPGRLANGDRRLQIYFDAYRLRLIEALATDHEALHASMGDADFHAACAAYVEATPSAFRNVRWYGGGLADFLQETAPWCEQPWLSEIARFEWTLTLAFDAADVSPVSFERMTALPAEAWSALCLRLHPSVQFLTLRSNAAAIRQAVDAGEPAPAVELRDAPIPWLIWRKGWSMSFRSLSAAESWALQAVRRGESFPALCEGLCGLGPPEEAPALAAGWLRAWVDDELIAGVAAE